MFPAQFVRLPASVFGAQMPVVGATTSSAILIPVVPSQVCVVL